MKALFIISNLLFFLSFLFADEYEQGRYAIVDEFYQYEKVFNPKEKFPETKEALELKEQFLKMKLPYDEITTIVKYEDEIWLGTTKGLIRYKDNKFKYFTSRRYLPSDYIKKIGIDENGNIFVLTDKGVGKLVKVKMTLDKKAQIIADKIRSRHIWNGFVREARLNKPEDLSRYFLIASDNDGLWTALYVAAASFQYAVTKDEKVKEYAEQSFDALSWLEKITPIEGFPARAIAPKGEPEREKYDGEWHLDKTGKWEWKGDTSSDELAGHFFAYSVFYDLCADENYKVKVREVVNRIATHLLNNNFCLIDVDGNPTTWAVFSPEKLNKDPKWYFEKGLNSLQILSHLKVAYHITGDKKYQDAYTELIEKHNYAINTITQKINYPGFIVHHDDQLAFLSYYPLLKYEQDKEKRKIYLESIERSWQIERPERSPLFNFIYCSATHQQSCDIENSVQTLKELPTDLIQYTMYNSHRKDIEIDKLKSRDKKPQSTEVLPYDERCFTRWDRNPYKLDDCHNGLIEGDGVVYLLPYWLGRYHGYIK